jgi:hypothetical protein
MFPGGSNPDNNLAERVLIAVGGGLLTVAPFLTWVSVVLLGDFNLTGLLSAAHASVAIAYGVTGIGVALILVAVLGRSMEGVRITALVCGAVVLLLGGYATYGLVRAVSGSAGLGQIGPGPILAVVGSVLLIVPPIVAYSRRPARVFVPGQVAPWRPPSWLPVVVGVVVASAVAWIPYHAGVNSYCGTAVGAAFKHRAPNPSETPPSNVASQFQQDQSAISAAQAAVNQQSQADASASQQQNSADSLGAQAQQADNAASNLGGTVSQDQGTVSSDQSTVSSDQYTVNGDQSTVQNEQQTISNDQTTLQNDQQTLASDQQAGVDTTFDQQTITNDQQTLANDQQTLATDQATMARDQQALQNDQATLSQANATMASDQKAMASAQANSSQLDQQAQSAENSAQNAASNAAQGDQSTQQQLSSAQQQLSTDQQNWQDTYQGELTSAQNYNTALSSCQSQADGHFIASGIIAGIAAGLTGLLFVLRRRQSPNPPTWGPPSAPFQPNPYG